ncbi:hypothetical protein QA601_11645 [Chitinispirillales bacterium ANBcel5]|uniref:hypothetical protein n=1 Tax=Cellulosispirillum alkaliphilum TaxID=3039283 RepID=UPI002A524FB6|nr:hypothetical protein [Chitinispirillales bacterium ANBcel5]
MKTINSKEELLTKLAATGDPIAFFTLFSDRIRSSFQLLCAEGKTFEEACEEVLPLCSKLYRAFIGKCVNDADDWFCSHWGGRYDAQYSNTSEKSGNAEKFSNRLQLFLLKEYGLLNAQTGKKKKRGLGASRSKSKIALLTIFIALGFIAISLSLLLFSNSSVSISFSNSQKSYELNFPGSILTNVLGSRQEERYSDTDPLKTSLEHTDTSEQEHSDAEESEEK